MPFVPRPTPPSVSAAIHVSMLWPEFDAQSHVDLIVFEKPYAAQMFPPDGAAVTAFTWTLVVAAAAPNGVAVIV
jgi:hypothetical protein